MEIDLLTAAQDGDEVQVRLLLQKGADIHIQNKNGRTDLLWQLKMDKEILTGKTALHWAINRRHPQIVRLLLKEGADPGITDNNGRTPPHTSASRGDPLLIQLLVSQGADVYASDDRGNTPSMLAQMAGHEMITEVLDKQKSVDTTGISTTILTTILGGHTDDVMEVSFSPNGCQLATASCDGTIKLWNPNTGHCVTIIHSKSTHCMSVAFSHNGSLLASRTLIQLSPSDLAWQGSAKVWDAVTGKLKNERYCSENNCGPMPFSPIQDLIAIGHGHNLVIPMPWTVWPFPPTDGGKDTVRIWHVGTGEVVQTVQQEGGPGLQVTFSPDGGLLACKLRDSVTIWRLTNGTIVKTLHIANSSNILISPSPRHWRVHILGRRAW
ncbi:quinon protein alcohol dehydrogenase-like superfamily [Aspergillus cavernicola]|uniref:Quinon protein alcohol dehydrogenase-like superfamily n=1 Tax=Aspergillus cavernicola TaxID=176166 RepID=A0ABR4HM90_9EURO